MKKHVYKSFVGLAGLIGILGVLVTIISDLILLGRPVSAWTFFRQATETMANLTAWRITLGTYLGVLALPFQLGGLIPVYFNLMTAGKTKALTVVFILAYTLMMGIAFHGAYAFIGSGWHLYVLEGSEAVGEMINRFDGYWRILLVVMSMGLFLGSIGYTRLVLTGMSRYAKWMALLNPLFIAAVLFSLILILPAPLGGYIAPAGLNLVTGTFFLVSWIVWSGTVTAK